MLVAIAAALVGAVLGVVLDRARRRPMASEQLVETSPTATSLVDAATDRYVAVNAAWEDLLGHRRVDVVGRPFQAFAPADDLPAVRQRLDALRRREVRSLVTERGYLRADGSVVHVVQSVSLLDAPGGRTLYVAQLFDRSAEVRAEDRFRRLLAALPAPVFWVGSDGVYRSVHLPPGTDPDVLPDSLVGRHLREVVPDAADRLETACARVTASGHAERLDVALPWSDGSAHVYEVNVSPCDDGVLMLSLDVTEDRRRAERLADAAAWSAALFERSGVPAWVLDGEGRVVEVNDAIADLVGRSRAELIGSSCFGLTDPSNRDLVLTEAAQLLSGASACSRVELDLVRPDGTRSPVLATTTLLPGNGDGPRFLGQLLDLSATRAADDARRVADDRLHGLVRALPDMVLHVGADRRVREVHVPASFPRTVGPGIVDIAGAAGRMLEDLRPAAAGSELLDAYLRADADGFGSAHTAFAHPDGGVGWRETRFARTDDGDLVVVVRDVTESTRARQALAEREAMFRALAEDAPVVVMHCDAEGRCVYANRRWTELVGRPAVDADGVGWHRWVHPEDLGAVLQVMQMVMGGGDRFVLRVRFVRPDGEVAWVDTRGGALRDDQGRVVGVIVVGADVTAQVRLAEETERLHDLLEASPDYVTIATPDGRLLFANQAAELVLPPGATLDALLTPASRRRFDDEVLGEVDRSGVWNGELDLVVGGDAVVPVSALVLARRDAAGHLEHLSMVARDISELKEAQRRLAHLATHDVLTGLANRALLQQRLEAALRTGAPADEPGVAVVYCDLDGFKAVNDGLGHDVGDRVLVTVAERIRAEAADGDVVARLGGDEFVVLVTDAVDRAVDLAHRLVASLSRPVPGVPLPVGTSVGVATAAAGADPDDVLSSADAAMYRAKSAGRSRVVVAGTVHPSAHAAS